MAQRYAYFFNPTCEMEVANGLSSYTAPSQMLKFSEDLELLPLVYASSQDCVLVRTLPSDAFLSRLEFAGFSLPEFQLLDTIDTLEHDYAPTPWGWSPAVARSLSPLGAEWNASLRPFYSRQFARQISLAISEKNIPQTIGVSQIARSVDTLAEVGSCLAQWGKMVIKAPYSSSGRGVQMLHKPDMNLSIINKTKSILKQQGMVMVEPLLDVLCDLAFEFKLEEGQVSFIGYSSFTTNEKGQYMSHQIPFLYKCLPDEVQILWDEGVFSKALEELQIALQQSDLPQHYEGCFGVDAFVFRDDDGKVLLQPCVEVNLRNNMGIVALHLEEHIAEGSRCDFQIATQLSISIPAFDIKMTNDFPLVFSEGKMVSGYLPLTFPQEGTLSMAYILVSDK